MNYKNYITENNVFVLFLCLNILAYAAVIRSNFFYNDDIYRVLYHFEGWETLGRPLATVLSKLFFGGTNADATPLLQILAIFALSAAGWIVFTIFKTSRNFICLLFFAPIATSSYMLENMSYKFDSLWMALSLLFSCMPFCCYAVKISAGRVFLLASLSIFLSLNLYQASAGSFLTIVCFLAIYEMYGENDLKRLVKQLYPVLLGYGLAFFIYALEVMYFYPLSGDYAAKHSSFVWLSLVHGVIGNVQSYATYLWEDWKNTGVGAIFVFDCLIVLFFSIWRIFSRAEGRAKAVNALLFVLLFALLLLSPYFPQFLLSNPVFRPRTFISFGVLVSLILFGSIQFSKQAPWLHKVVVVVNLYFVFQLLVIANIYGNLLDAQAVFERNRLPMITYQLAKTKQATGCGKFDIKGSLGYTPTLKTIENHFPILRKLVPPSVSDWFFAQYQFEFYGIKFSGRERLNDLGGLQIYYDEPDYSIGYAEQGVCVIRFGDSR